MSPRVPTRKGTPPSMLGAEIKPAMHCRRVKPPLDPLIGPTSNLKDLVDVANAVLGKLQEQDVFNHNTGNQDLLSSAVAPAVQGSVVAEADNIVISHTETPANIAACVNDLDQAKGSVAAVLDGLSGATSVITKPKDIFVSTNIPIDMEGC